MANTPRRRAWLRCTAKERNSTACQMTTIELILTLVAAIALVPLAVLVIECVAALLPTRRWGDSARPSCAVVVPAHNEEAALVTTLAELKSQLHDGDRLLVIADNCTDATAAVARAAGAEVLERRNHKDRGKGFALAAGVDMLRAGPPEIVVIIDADCLPAANAIDRLVKAADASGRPIQAAYILDPAANAGMRSRLSAWAVRFKNLVRPRGLRRLGAPCLLTGSGMAFPWRLLRDAPLASGHIVEDMQLGIDLAVAGFAPEFEPSAVIRGELPGGDAAASIQRTRWEHGHLSTLLSQSPRLLVEALKQRRPALAALALELSVPPLSMLLCLWGFLLASTSVSAVLGQSWLPAIMLLSGGAITAMAGLATWARFGREVLPLKALLAAPLYIAWKLPIYAAFLFKPQRTWVRTPRPELSPESTGELAR